MSEQIRELIHKAAEDENVVEQLRTDPGSLKDEFDLSDADVASLKRATYLMVAPSNPLLAANITLPPITITGGPGTFTTSPITITGGGAPDTTMTTSPITITVTSGGQFRDSGDPDPTKLEDLVYDDLLKLTELILGNAAFAARVRVFLGIAEG